MICGWDHGGISCALGICPAAKRAARVQEAFRAGWRRYGQVLAIRRAAHLLPAWVLMYDRAGFDYVERIGFPAPSPSTIADSGGDQREPDNGATKDDDASRP